MVVGDSSRVSGETVRPQRRRARGGRRSIRAVRTHALCSPGTTFGLVACSFGHHFLSEACSLNGRRTRPGRSPRHVT